MYVAIFHNSTYSSNTLTGVKHSYASKKQIPVENVTLAFQLTQTSPTLDASEYTNPEDGVQLQGVILVCLS